MEKITEDYCSYEIAKLLEEKGFDIPCKYAWHGGIKEPDFYRHSINFNGGDYKDLRTKWYSAPTHQIAMKWLREVHRKYIDIRYNNQNKEYRFIVFTMVKDKPIDFIHSEYHSTYEEAVEAALKYCLTKLI